MPVRSVRLPVARSKETICDVACAARKRIRASQVVSTGISQKISRFELEDHLLRRSVPFGMDNVNAEFLQMLPAGMVTVVCPFLVAIGTEGDPFAIG
jgi:hypothetical protein